MARDDAAPAMDVDVDRKPSPYRGHWPTMHIEHATASRSVKGEDSMVFSPLNDEGTMPARDVMFVLCDGHVGKAASSHAVANAAKILKAKLPSWSPDPDDAKEVERYAGDVRQAIARTFVELDNSLLAQIHGKARAGSTVTMVVVTGALISVANIGDTEAVLDTGAIRMVMTNSHRLATSESEVARVRDCGLRVSPLGFDLRGPCKAGEPGVGPLRLWPGGLAVSRALGDFDSGTSVSPLPNVKQVRLTQGGCRIIVATDGLWDSISHRKSAAQVRALPIFSAAAELVRLSTHNKRVTDDTSVMVVDVLADGEHHFPEMAMQARTAYKRDGSLMRQASSSRASTQAPRGCFACFGTSKPERPSMDSTWSRSLHAIDGIDATRRGLMQPSVVTIADVDTLTAYPAMSNALRRPHVQDGSWRATKGGQVNAQAPDSPRTNDTCIDVSLDDFSVGSTRSHARVNVPPASLGVVRQSHPEPLLSEANQARLMHDISHSSSAGAAANATGM